jgi:hypothetical protein
VKRGGLRYTEEEAAAMQKRLAHVPDRALVTPPRLTAEQRKNERARTMLENLALAPAGPVKPAKRAKYASKKVEQDGEKFDSQKELRRWNELQMMQAEGQISDLRRQVAFELAPAVHLLGEARMKPALRYWADAVYQQNGVQVVEDTKSAPTRKKEAYRIKKHLLATVHGIHIKEV